MSNTQAIGTIKAAPVRSGQTGGWLHSAAYAAVGWSVVYAVLGVYGLVSRTGFPLGPAVAPDSIGPLVGRLGAGAAWFVLILAGIPAAALGAAMLRGVHRGALRPLFIASGALLAGTLLLLMIGLELLIALGYVPITIFKVLTGGDASFYIQTFVQWTVGHQLLCLIGGFLWLGATVSYARRSADACLSCGRRDGPEGWQGPDRAARWGRVAVYVAMVAPIFYTFTRYAWALGWPLGMSQEYWRAGQARGTWISGLFLASFALLGALLMLGLAQRWGEVFPGWVPALGGRRVPVALAITPAALVSVVVLVGGIVIWSGIPSVLANARSLGMGPAELRGAILFQLGPTLLFPAWGVALAVATLGYYYRRRGPCKVCGRGA